MATTEVARKEGDDRRRSIGTERGADRILGGSDPTLSGFSAANAFGAGVATPKLSADFLAPVAGRVAAESPTTLIKQQQRRRRDGPDPEGRTPQERRYVSARSDEEGAHDASALCGSLEEATHESIIGESFENVLFPPRQGVQRVARKIMQPRLQL